MIAYDVPPRPAILAQSFFNSNNAIGSDLSRLSTRATDTPAATQHAVDTISVENFLKAKFTGISVPITGPSRQTIGRAMAINFTKKDTMYTCEISTRQQGTTLMTQVIFEGFIQDVPSQKRWAMSVNEQQGKKRVLEIENQLSSEISPIGNSDNTVGTSLISPGTLPEPAPDLLPEGESLSVLDLKTMQSSVQNVVIYKGLAYLSNGVPLNVRLEYQP